MSWARAIIAAADAFRSRKYSAIIAATSTRKTTTPRAIFVVTSPLHTGPMYEVETASADTS